MWSSKMLAKIVCFMSIFNIGFWEYATGESSTPHNLKGRPFAELPCLTIGGTCAEENNCSKISRVPIKGLCPLQQKEGIECCKPENPLIRCRSRGGNCESVEDIECPQFLTVKEATDCGRNEMLLFRKLGILEDCKYSVIVDCHNIVSYTTSSQTTGQTYKDATMAASSCIAHSPASSF